VYRPMATALLRAATRHFFHSAYISYAEVPDPWAIPVIARRGLIWETPVATPRIRICSAAARRSSCQLAGPWPLCAALFLP
jgi:hypothetical protein